MKAKDILGKGDYEYAIPFYGGRRPTLVDLALRMDDAREKGDSPRGQSRIYSQGSGIYRQGHGRLWGQPEPNCGGASCGIFIKNKTLGAELAAEAACTNDDVDKRPIGGLVIYLIQSFVDCLRYEFVDGRSSLIPTINRS